MILTPEQVLKHIGISVGADGVWIEFKTKTGKHYVFQPTQEFKFRNSAVEWAQEIQEYYRENEPMNDRYGQIAYDAYCEERKWKSVKGEPLPHWREQSEELRRAWIAAAMAVENEIATQQGRRG